MLAIFPEIAAAVSSQSLENLACLVREYFGGQQKYSPVLDVPALVKMVGIEQSIFPGLGCHGVLAVKDQGGAFQVTFVLGGSSQDSIEHSFLLAHQLGHYFYDVQPYLLRGEWQDSGLKELQCPYHRYLHGQYGGGEGASDIEERADLFAASLLLPASLLSRAYSKLGSLESLAAFFHLPQILIARRLEALKLVADRGDDSFLASEAVLANTAKPQPAKPAPNLPSRAASEPALTRSKVSRSEAGDSNPLEKSLQMFRKLAGQLDQEVDS